MSSGLKSRTRTRSYFKVRLLYVKRLLRHACTQARRPTDPLQHAAINRTKGKSCLPETIGGNAGDHMYKHARDPSSQTGARPEDGLLQLKGFGSNPRAVCAQL
jgi:hypothetical protein